MHSLLTLFSNCAQFCAIENLLLYQRLKHVFTQNCTILLKNLHSLKTDFRAYKR